MLARVVSCCPTIPSWRPRARGNLFDGTEIEEALLLHVQALSDGEREAIDEQDPAVREMIERAAAATPEDLFRLHGRDAAHSDRRAAPTPRARPRSRRTGACSGAAAGGAAPRAGTTSTTACWTAGRPPWSASTWTGRQVHLGLTIDDDPGRDLMRDQRALHFFKPDEVEIR